MIRQMWQRFQATGRREGHSDLKYAPYDMSQDSLAQPERSVHARAMKAAEQALNESRYDEAAQCCSPPFRYAETFSRGINGSIKTVGALATLLYTRATTQKPSERISRNKEAKVTNGNIFATRGSLFQSRLALSKTTSLFLAIGLTSERISDIFCRRIKRIGLRLGFYRCCYFAQEQS